MVQDDFFAGARVALYLKDMGAVTDWFEIHRLNRRSVAAWTRGNNSGNAETMTRGDAQCERIWDKVTAIAAKRGWKICNPRLWWIVEDTANANCPIR